MAETVDWRELHQIPLFAELTEDEIYEVLKLAFIKKYQANATLFLEGMKREVLYVVKHGKVGIFKKTDNGEVLLAELGAGECLGELSLIDDEKRSASARVLEESELVVVTRKCFNDLLNADPKITSKLLMYFIKITARRLRQTDKKFEGN